MKLETSQDGMHGQRTKVPFNSQVWQAMDLVMVDSNVDQDWKKGVGLVLPGTLFFKVYVSMIAGKGVWWLLRYEFTTWALCEQGGQDLRIGMSPGIRSGQFDPDCSLFQWLEQAWAHSQIQILDLYFRIQV